MCAEETWRILISDDVGSGGAGAAQGGGGVEDEAVTQGRTKQFQENMNQLFGWFKPFIITGGIFYMLYQHSQIVSTVMGTIGKILGVIMDVILLPFMPLFVAVVNAIVPLIPIIQKMSEAFFKPIVDFLVGKVNAFANWVMNTVDWNKIERWLADAGETVVGWIETVFNWISGTFFPWWSEHAWPWLTKQWNAFYDWITNLDWDDIWAVIKKLPSIILHALEAYIAFRIGLALTTFGLITMIGTAIIAAIMSSSLNPVGWFIGGASLAMGVGALAAATTWGSQALSGKQTGGQIYTEGNYRLHAGERVINENENKYGGGGGVAMTNTFNIELALTGTVDDLAREIESKITDKLTKIQRRG